jgi:YHS domain-containing protein
MQVEIAHAPAHRAVAGQDFYFCSDHCAARFDSDPTRFATPEHVHS